MNLFADKFLSLVWVILACIMACGAAVGVLDRDMVYAFVNLLTCVMASFLARVFWKLYKTGRV